jgi:hypothetical protein
MPRPVSKPSISLSSWFRVCSFSSLLLEQHDPEQRQDDIPDVELGMFFGECWHDTTPRLADTGKRRWMRPDYCRLPGLRRPDAPGDS